jgi:hypothetical protein
MIEDIMRANLLVVAQAYADAKGWSLSTVSKQIHGNQAFLAQFLAGEVSTTIRTYEQMVGTLRRNWPAGVAWPQTRDVPRPTRVPYQPRNDMPERGTHGEFLKKKPKRGARRA